MVVVETVLILVALVILSNIISHYVVAIPVSLIQAGLGVIAALVWHFELDMATDWFMLLFIAPMLFNDGQHFPKRELWALRGPIVGNAIFLVFLTTVVGGWFIHWLIPGLPLAASLALAAIMSPTDPIAVQSLAARIHLPSRILHLVSGESLINDASGLIGFKYGIAAALTGTFAFGRAVGDFIYIGIVGALAGAVLMAVINGLRGWLLQQGINDVILHTVLNLVTPFVIYLVVDEMLHASGVIAVVVAGLLSNTRGNRYLLALPELRIVSARTWDIVVYVLNGIIFLILGIELPVAMSAAITARSVHTGRALFDVVAVYVVVLVLRVLWTYGYMWVGKNSAQPSWRTAWISGVSGVRGAITVVGVLAVPLTLGDGTAFPERNLMLFVAAGYVVLSLIAAVVLLPLLTNEHLTLQLRGSRISADPDVTPEAEAAPRRISLPQAQRFLYQTVVRRVESERREDNQKPALDLISEYQHQLRRLELAEADEGELPSIVRDELMLRVVGLQGELGALQDLQAAGTIDATQYAKNERALRHRLAELELLRDAAGGVPLRVRLSKWQRWWQVLWARILRRRQPARYAAQLATEKALAKGGLKHLSAFLKQPEQRKRGYNRQVIYTLIVQYRNRIASVKAINELKSTRYEHEIARLRAVALAAERAAIHELLEQGYISTSMAQQLNQSVNYTESAAAMSAVEA
ncbi:cation:proton antiporter [Lacticaseibacillus nasuensis]|uniref:cation:proton antiporter n=1 Tax=Lacticaseibacillus nasuensis TaxID=944671 RepID=UPI002246119C|nr:cation:proton antiporter [Lacticaseibacillus nasuensis]MCX2454736.1 cation:proton antiporter [Lacticaseibacillus nasuensis]